MQETHSASPDLELIAACASLGGRRRVITGKLVAFDFDKSAPPPVSPNLSLHRLEFCEGMSSSKREKSVCEVVLRHHSGCTLALDPPHAVLRVQPDGCVAAVSIIPKPSGQSTICGVSLGKGNWRSDLTPFLQEQWAVDADDSDAKLVLEAVNELAQTAMLPVFPLCHFPRAAAVAVKAGQAMRRHFETSRHLRTSADLPDAGTAHRTSLACGKT